MVPHEERRIIYVWNYREWGGAQIYFLSLMKAARGKYAVLALLPADSDRKLLDYLDESSISYEFLDASPDQAQGKTSLYGRLRRRIALFRSENQLANRILRRQHLSQTVVHIDMGFWLSFRPLRRLARHTNVVMTLHTALPPVSRLRSLIWRAKGRHLSKLPTFHLMASNGDAKEGVRPYVTSPMFDSIEVAYSGYDADEVGVAHQTDYDVSKKYRFPEDTPLIATSGQFIERKGCWTILESLRQLRDQGTTVNFLWLGTSTPDPTVSARIGEYELDASFRLLTPDEIGPTRHDLLVLVATVDIFVLASVQEGLPISLIEAMALGRPCIATRVGAIPEAIDHLDNGLLIEPNDPAALAEAITDLLTNPPKRVHLGTKAASTVRGRFDAARSAEIVVKFYDSIWQT